MPLYERQRDMGGTRSYPGAGANCPVPLFNPLRNGVGMLSCHVSLGLETGIQTPQDDSLCWKLGLGREREDARNAVPSGTPPQDGA